MDPDEYYYQSERMLSDIGGFHAAYLTANAAGDPRMEQEQQLAFASASDARTLAVNALFDAQETYGFTLDKEQGFYQDPTNP